MNTFLSVDDLYNNIIIMDVVKTTAVAKKIIIRNYTSLSHTLLINSFCTQYYYQLSAEYYNVII